HVQTTPAPLSDEGVLSEVHADLAEKALLPNHHLVDAGYVTAINLVKAQAGYGVDLVGPTLKTHWYQAETGYDITHFSSNWEAETVRCPPGRNSSSCTQVQDSRGKPLTHVKFSVSDCRACPSRALSYVREQPDGPSVYSQESRCKPFLPRASERRPMSL